MHACMHACMHLFVFSSYTVDVYVLRACIHATTVGRYEVGYAFKFDALSFFTHFRERPITRGSV